MLQPALPSYIYASRVYSYINSNCIWIWSPYGLVQYRSTLFTRWHRVQRTGSKRASERASNRLILPSIVRSWFLPFVLFTQSVWHFLTWKIPTFYGPVRKGLYLHLVNCRIENTVSSFRFGALRWCTHVFQPVQRQQHQRDQLIFCGGKNMFGVIRAIGGKAGKIELTDGRW